MIDRPASMPAEGRWTGAQELPQKVIQAFAITHATQKEETSQYTNYSSQPEKNDALERTLGTARSSDCPNCYHRN